MAVEPLDMPGASVDAVASLPSDLALMKLENENIMALAAARPRDHKAIVAEIASQLEAYPSFAAQAVYAKPVGRDTDGNMRYARGLSIRAAEAVAEAYGYNRTRADVQVIDDDHVKVTATFTDYQRGRIWQDSRIISAFYKTRGGKTARHTVDRFHSVVVGAEVSRRIREVILRSVPPGLRSELMTMADRQIDELLDDRTIQKIIAEYSTKGVTLEMLETHVGRTADAGWTKEDRRDLLELWNAIKDGHTTIQEAFGGQTAEPDAEPDRSKGDRIAEKARAAKAAAEAPAEPKEEAKADAEPEPKPKVTKSKKVTKGVRIMLDKIDRAIEALAAAAEDPSKEIEAVYAKLRIDIGSPLEDLSPARQTALLEGLQWQAKALRGEK